MSAFKRPQIGDIRHHHDDRGIAPRVSADGAGVLRIDVTAGMTNLNFSIATCSAADSGVINASRFLIRCSAARRAERKPRQPRQQLNQALDLWTCNRSDHSRKLLESSNLYIVIASQRPASQT
jgi:hypothetical protein